MWVVEQVSLVGPVAGPAVGRYELWATMAETAMRGGEGCKDSEYGEITVENSEEKPSQVLVYVYH